MVECEIVWDVYGAGYQAGYAEAGGGSHRRRVAIIEKHIQKVRPLDVSAFFLSLRFGLLVRFRSLTVILLCRGM